MHASSHGKSNKSAGWKFIVYLQVNALSEWIIGIYLHEFTNNELEIFNTARGQFRVHC